MGDIDQPEAASVTKEFVSSLLLGQRDTAEAFADCEELILLGNVVGSCNGALLPYVISTLQLRLTRAIVLLLPIWK